MFRLLLIVSIFRLITSGDSELNIQTRNSISVVSIQNATIQKHFCNGVILFERWILTSAKCVQNRRPDELNIFYGSKHLKQHGTYVGVKQIISNPTFNESRWRDDIALIFTTDKINFVVNVTGPAVLPAKDVPINQNLVVSGWRLMNVSMD